ncbi:hypothetical protein ACJU26_09645 [Acidithiobacillus sp. M4-SHS-6]|uniref:hypothetical protein n=1 Tax=Acidithiobacillus sp. M4-SHS-6 TaxID=3383024 RepID=UPI0039BE14E0
MTTKVVLSIRGASRTIEDISSEYCLFLGYPCFERIYPTPAIFKMFSQVNGEDLISAYLTRDNPGSSQMRHLMTTMFPTWLRLRMPYSEMLDEVKQLFNVFEDTNCASIWEWRSKMWGTEDEPYAGTLLSLPNEARPYANTGSRVRHIVSVFEMKNLFHFGVFSKILERYPECTHTAYVFNEHAGRFSEGYLWVNDHVSVMTLREAKDVVRQSFMWEIPKIRNLVLGRRLQYRDVELV